MKFKYKDRDGALVAHINVTASITAEDVVKSIAHGLYSVSPDYRKTRAEELTRAEVEERLRTLHLAHGLSWAEDGRFDVSDREEYWCTSHATNAARRLFPELADDLL